MYPYHWFIPLRQPTDLIINEAMLQRYLSQCNATMKAFLTSQSHPSLPDGNCLFHLLCKQMTGDHQHKHAELRELHEVHLSQTHSLLEEAGALATVPWRNTLPRQLNYRIVWQSCWDQSWCFTVPKASACSHWPTHCEEVYMNSVSYISFSLSWSTRISSHSQSHSMK